MPGIKTRLAPAVVGTVVAVGLSLPAMLNPATAAPGIPMGAPIKWSAELGPVPKASTNTAPALATVSLPGNRKHLLLFWTGPATSPSDLPISYQTSISLRRNLWSRPAMVDFGKAITRTRPAATAIGPAGSGQVIVVWRDSAGRLLYSIGKAGKGNTLTWNGVTAIRGAASSNGPAVYTALHSNAVLLVWKAASGDAIDFVVGVPDFPTVKWGKIGEIPRAATTATPAIAEVSTGKGVGEIFVLWKAPGKTGPVDFALTTDPLRPFPRWTSPRSLSPKIRTGASPSAQAAGTGTLFPLLVVFQVARGPVLEYVTLAKNGAITGPLKVPHIGSVNGTAINPGVLAAEAPDPRKVFYEPFVRPCAGC